MGCFFMHNWNQWETYKRETRLTYIFLGKIVDNNVEVTEIMQRRTCKVCGKLQIRSVI